MPGPPVSDSPWGDLGAAVIHYDRDYDTLAEQMGFESIWLALAGTLP